MKRDHWALGPKVAGERSQPTLQRSPELQSLIGGPLLGRDAEAPLKQPGGRVRDEARVGPLLGRDAEASLKLDLKRLPQLVDRRSLLARNAEAPLKHGQCVLQLVLLR